MNDQSEMLSPYRVLDLTNERGHFAGKLLADLGADVIKVEPPHGDPSRKRAPFVDDIPGPDRGLRWLAWNTNKRSVTIDLSDSAGQRLFLQLAQSADFVVESFAPGRMDELGLGYDVLSRANPGLILVSISPFGQTGPYRDYQATDIVAWAMSGNMSITGESSRPPSHISDDCQSFLHAGGDAVIGALIALIQRARTGRGQHVDLSIQEATARGLYQISGSWDMTGRNLGRDERPTVGGADLPWTWRCRDGYVIWLCAAGPGASQRLSGLFAWLDEIGEGRELQSIDWDHLPLDEMSATDWEPLGRLFAELFINRTKHELYEAATRHNFLLYPSATSADTLANAQLQSREFWRDVHHPEIGRTVRFPGAIAKCDRPVPPQTHPAPALGQHNDEVFAELANTPSPSNGIVLGSSDVKPLAGIKIADFGWFMVGPLTIKAFSDFGADVIHVESTARLDALRIVGPFKDDVPDPERCGEYAQVRTGGRTINVNLGTEEGKEIARRLVRWADIVFDNFSAGAMDRMGLGREALRKLNPDVIVLSSSGQGQDGPHAHGKGGGGHYAALAGFNELTGWPEGEPGYLSAYTDFIAPRFNIPLLMSALDHRRRTGEGQCFDVSQYEAAVHWLTPSILEYTINHRVPNRNSNRQPDAAPHGAYRCADDRWCVIAVTDDDEWQSLGSAMEAPALADDPRFASLQGRKTNEDELDRIVEEWTSQRDAYEVMDLLQRLGVPAGVVQTGEDLLEHDPQLRHRNFYQALDHPVMGTYRAPQASFRLSDAPCELQRVRLFGEDTYEVLSEVLDYSDAEIERFALAEALK
ncbi:MAG: CoA transferase [Chloroflexota bacterium]|nr:CoA transferase [Chloroflexota bacterium]